MEEITVGLRSLAVDKREYLLVLDMNQLLMYREPFSEKSKRKRDVWKRPHLDDFLDYIFANFTVGVWSSMTLKNLKPLQKFVFGEREPRFTFDNSHCDKEKHPDKRESKPLLKKPLSKVWKLYPEYSAANTLLIDDSVDKAKDNPSHLLFCPDPWTVDCTDDEINNALAPDGIIRSYLHRLLDSGLDVAEFVALGDSLSK